MLKNIIKKILYILTAVGMLISLCVAGLSMNEKTVSITAQKLYSTLKHDPNPDNFYKDPLRIAKWTDFTKKTLSLIAQTIFVTTLFALSLTHVIPQLFYDAKRLRLKPQVFIQNFKKEYLLLFLFSILFFILKLHSNLTPLINDDGYHNMMFNFWENKGLTHNNERHFVYPFIIMITTFLSNNNYSAFTILQHLCGIMTSIVLYFSISQIRRILPDHNKILQIGCTVTSFAAFFLYNLNNIPFYWEKYYMREGITPLFYMLIVFLIISLIIDIFKEKTSSVQKNGILLIINYFIICIQPKWGMVFIPLSIAILYLVLKEDKKTPFKSKIIYTILIPLFFCFFLLHLPEEILKYTDKPKTFGPANLFYGQMNCIIPVIKEDIANPDFKKYDKELLSDIVLDYQNARTEDYKYHTIGYNPNNLIYGGSKRKVLAHFDRSSKSFKNFCFDYYIRAAINYPNLFLQKVILVLGDYYGYDAARINYFSQIDWKQIYYNEFSEDRIYKRSVSPNITGYYSRLHDSYTSARIQKYPEILVTLFKYLNLLFYPLLFINFFILIFTLFKKDRNLLISCLIVFIPLIVVFIINLLTAVSYILIPRYIHDYMVLSIFYTAYSLLNIFLLVTTILKKNHHGELNAR